MQVLDSAEAIPAGPAKAAGYVGVARYLSDYGPKCITPTELAADLAASLGVAFVFEDVATDMQGGATAGTAHGQTIRRLLEELGVDPGHAVVYLACDEDLPTAAYELSWETLSAAVAAGGFIPGGYGPVPWLLFLLSKGVRYGWSTASSSFNAGLTGGQLRQRVDQVIVGGVTCDVNDVTAADWGQWPRPFVTPPAPPTQEVYMIPTGCTDAGAVRAQIRDWWNTYRTDGANMGKPISATTSALALDVLVEAFGLPTAQGGFGGDPDALLAHIIDTGQVHGVLRPELAGSV